jgi:AI-2E family transporter
MVGAVRGTVNGTVLVAFAEGLLIGIAYLLAGVPSPVLFTLLTIAFAMVPFGAWAAFSVASVVLSDGNLWSALGVFGWGVAVMLAGDHFVWPSGDPRHDIRRDRQCLRARCGATASR